MKHFLFSFLSIFLFVSCDLMDESANDEKDINTCIQNLSNVDGAKIKNVTDDDVLIQYMNVDTLVECVKDNQKTISKVTIKKEVPEEYKIIKPGKLVTLDYQKEVSDAAIQVKSENAVCTTIAATNYKVVGKCPYKPANPTGTSTNDKTNANSGTNTSSTSSTNTSTKAASPAQPLERNDSLRAVYP